jgi:DNA-directed RNA polymerase subunit RPC12/RpoP
MNEIWELWEKLKSEYGSRQTAETYYQLRDRLPRRLPKNAGVELPESGSALVPAEKLREIFPEFSWLIDQGWKVFVTQDGCLVWWYPLYMCPACGQEADLVAESVVPISNWNAMVTDIFRCPACGYEWWYEYQM